MPNITIAGNQYPNVPAVTIPITGGGGVAQFTDISETTATAADVKSGKKIFLADGSPATGSYEWNWMGDTWELIDDNIYSSSEYLKDTAYATWTPSTTALALEATKSLTARAINLANYEYLIRWRFDSFLYYSSGVTMKAVPIQQSIEMFQVVMKRPSNITNLQSGTFNGNACVTLLTAPVIDYYSTSGTRTAAWTASYGVYAAVNAATFSSSTSNTPNLTIKTPTVSVRCNSTYFATARAPYVDQDRSNYKVTGMLYRTPRGGTARSIYGDVVNLYNNPMPREALTITVHGTDRFTVSGDVNVDFGDTNTDYSGVDQQVDFSYDDALEHTIRITGYLTDISFTACLTLVSVDTPFPKSMSAKTSFANCFAGCIELTAIPTGLFDNCTGATNFSNCFSSCAALTAIPNGLFDDCTGATTFQGCFTGCRSLTSIPTGLFDNNIAATAFADCFRGANNLTAIPAGLFDNNTAVTTFRGCFYGDSSLTGAAPELWDSTTWPNVTAYAACFYGCTGLTNYNDIPSDWKTSSGPPQPEPGMF